MGVYFISGVVKITELHSISNFYRINNSINNWHFAYFKK